MRPCVYLACVCSLLLVDASPIEYTRKDHQLYPDLVAVSSTVIPLEDLPVYRVGIGFDIGNMPQFRKPTNPVDVELVTAKKGKKPIYTKKASIKELSKKEFKKYKQ